MRRHVVLGMLVVTGGLSIALHGFQQPPSARKVAKIETMRPGRNLYLITGGGGNTAALVTETGVVLVDAKLVGWGQAVLDALSLVTENPVTAIINTHTHADHTGSNAEFPAVTEIVAHANTKTNMERMDAFKGAGARFLPKKTFADKTTLQYGEDRIDLYYFGAGHTNGDAIVVFPALRVAHFGDLFASKGVPFIDTANGGSGVALPRTLASAIAEIKDVDKVIPGHLTYPTGAEGAVVPRWKDLQEYAEFTRELLAAVQDAQKTAKTVDDAVASLKPLSDKYKDYGMERAKATAQAIYDELTASSPPATRR